MSAPAKKAAAKSRPAPSHPSFKDMIAAAIKNLADKKGSSRHAIRKYITTNYKVGEVAVKSNLNKSLSKLVAANYLVHPKTSTGRFKLNKVKSEQSKVAAKKKKPAAKKPAAKKPAKTDGAKKAPSKKPKAKKAAGAKKPAAKKPAKKNVKKAAKKPAAKKSPKKSAKKPTKKTTAAKKK